MKIIYNNKTLRVSVPLGSSVSKHELAARGGGSAEIKFRKFLSAQLFIEKLEAHRFLPVSIVNEDQLEGLEKTIFELSNEKNLATTAFSYLLYKIRLEEFYGEDCLAKSAEDGLPRHFFNLVNGGEHVIPRQRSPQEVGVVLEPKTERLAYLEQLRAVRSLLERMLSRSEARGSGFEGGVVFPESLDLLGRLSLLRNEGAEELPGFVGYYSDVAAECLTSDGGYRVSGKEFSSKEWKSYFREVVREYKIVAIEDPFAESDTTNWSSAGFVTVADDPIATNLALAEASPVGKTSSGYIVKPDQPGSAFVAEGFVNSAKKRGKLVVVSHRSGETCERLIADFALFNRADIVKFGAPNGSERMAKYNRYLELLR